MADVSAGGAALVLPPGVPVRVGQRFRLERPGEPLSPDAPPGALEARVVRVDRSTLVSRGHVSVGVAFEDSPQ